MTVIYIYDIYDQHGQKGTGMDTVSVAGVRRVLKIMAGDGSRHTHWEWTVKDSYAVLWSHIFSVGDGGQWEFI